MYDRDMPKIAAYGLGSPQGLTDVLTFVALTIRQPLHQIHSQLDDVRRQGEASRFLFGSKRQTYLDAKAQAPELLPSLIERRESGPDGVAAAVWSLSRLSGLGMVKAAFAAQCLGFEASCIDSHNAARLGMPDSALRLPKKLSEAGQRKRIADYLSMCVATGGAAFWWNSWCEYVAGRRGSPLATGDAVSAYHPQALGLS